MLCAQHYAVWKHRYINMPRSKIKPYNYELNFLLHVAQELRDVDEQRILLEVESFELLKETLLLVMLMLMTSLTFSPSAVQSDIGQPWSAVENGHAPLDMWRYQLSRSPGQLSITFHIKQPTKYWNLMSTCIDKYIRMYLWLLNVMMCQFKGGSKFFDKVGSHNGLNCESYIPELTAIITLQSQNLNLLWKYQKFSSFVLLIFT